MKWRHLLTLICVAAWAIVVWKFENVRIFTLTIPPVFVFNCTKNKQWRNRAITFFVVIWLLVFNYESVRHFYLEPALNQPLPKFKFLFPPAGWIMFYNVNDSFGYAEVYGMKGEQMQLLDPHHIIRTRTIGYDNIHRNILSAVSQKSLGPAFCRFLEMKFPDFDNFAVTTVWYPSLVKEPHHRLQQLVYVCHEQKNVK